MVDYAPPWDAHPRDTLHASHDVPIEQVRRSAATLATLLDEKKEEQVLKEACLGLCQLFGEGIQNDRIQAILEANVVPKLVNLLRPSRSRPVPISVQLAALQVLGNVACGDDQQTQVVIDSDALPCLRALLFSSDRQIRKEVCWIVSNITESSHQVQDVLDADILPPLLKLLDNQDGACREDATWVLFNLSSNRVPKQIAYLAENDGIRALCNLLTCQKELDVLWKGCGTVAAVALKGLRNVLVSGQIIAASNPEGHNEMAALVAEAHGVERIEALTTHNSPDVRNRARLILERIFGTEPSTMEPLQPFPFLSVSTHARTSQPCPRSPSLEEHMRCSCGIPQNQAHHHKSQSHNYHHGQGVYGLSREASSFGSSMSTNPHASHGVTSNCVAEIYSGAEVIGSHASTSGSSTDSDPDEDDSDSDLIPPPPAPCSCLLCTDLSPLAERRPRGKGPAWDDPEFYRRSTATGAITTRSICSFCSGGGRLGDGRAGLAAKLGRAVRLGHPHCLAIILSRMTWSQRVAATEAPALLHPGGGPPDGGVGSSLPAIILSAQLGKPLCLSLLLKRCQPNLDLTYGKKRLTALAWASHKGYLRCCQLLLEHGANPATTCGEAVTALHLAASGGGHVAICKLLLDHLAPVNARSAKKQTPLCLAAQKGYSKIVQVLLDAGADPNNQDEGKYTPLHLAASNGHLQTVNILLSHGAGVDATTRNEVTPLHYAVQGGHSQVVQALISSGAKVNCSKKPLLLIAADDGKLDIVNLLLNADASIDCRANIRAILDKETEVCDYLTPLHLAASKNHHDVVDALVRRGADVNELTAKSRWSALDFSVLNGHSESAIILLQHGAIVSDTCKSIGRNNWTLVQYAASNGAKDVVRLLIQRIKEQRANNTASVHLASTSLARPSAAKSSSAGPFIETLGSEGLVQKPYSVNENVQTCSACSKLRQSSCTAQSKNNTYASTTVGSRDQHIRDIKNPEKAESLSISSVYEDVCTSETKAKHRLSRRKVVKDDRQTTLRAREIKKRENEAREARGRLEEAISQRSVAKLTEAISHVSKLVLHLAASVGCDGPKSHSEHGDTSEHDTFNGAYNHSGLPQPSRQKYSSNTSSSSLISAPLAMEVGLGNEVQKARKILASLLAEEKRVREEKEKEAMDSKRENAQQIVRKAIGSALDGGDPRSLSRAVNRATKTILDSGNPIVMEATRISVLLSRLEKYEQIMRNAIDSEDLESLKESLSELKKDTNTLNSIGGAGATARIFRGIESKEAIARSENVMNRLREKRQREEAEQIEAMVRERKVNEELQEAMKLDDISQLENIINRACEVLISKHSALANTIEAAKKLKARRLKIERRKLRQASYTNDPSKIEEAVSIAEGFGLCALRHDVEAAKAHARKLREQAAAAEDLKHAMSRADVNVLTVLRSKLNSLGMFSEAETARSEIERLQRAIRAGTLLDATVQESKTFNDNMKLMLLESKTVAEIMNGASTWSWPDVGRLSYLSDRARQHGSLHNSICESADRLVKELVSLGQRLLGICLESNDARAIAATITGFERTFTAVIRAKEIDCEGCERAVSMAKQHLAHIQAMDQASVKAESAQVKVEYALATSRRSAARNRQVKGSVVPAFGGHILDGHSTKSELNGAVIVGTSPVCSSRVSAALVENEGCEPGTVYKNERSQVPRSIGDHLATSLKRANVRAQEREESALHESFEVSIAAPGDCSHFYLFKEGNTVCCARCGNHRSSSNPEWLARVKKRGNSIPQDIISEWSEQQDILEREDKQTDLRKVYSSDRGTALDTRGVGSSLDQGYAKARMENVPVVHASPQSFSRSRISSREAPHNLQLSSHHGNVNVMVHMLQEQKESQLVPSGPSHRFRGRGQQLPPSNIVRRTPSMFHMDVTTCPQVSPGIRSSGSEGITSFSHSRIPSIVPRVSGEHGAADSYGVADGLLGLNTSASRTSDSMNSPLARQGLQTARIVIPRPDTGRSDEIGVGLPTTANSLSEDMAEVGRDLCTDFANENFGFDIDAIVDEPAPLGRAPLGRI